MREGSNGRRERAHEPANRDTPVVELNSNASLLAVDTFGPNGLISRHSGSSSVLYTFDERGNTVERFDGSGNVLNAITSDDYGLSNASGSASDPFGYFGGQWGYYADGNTPDIRLVPWSIRRPLE